MTNARALKGQPLLYWAIGLGAALLCMALYFPALNAPLFFDDIPNLAENALVQISGEAFDGWRAAALSSNSGEIERSVSMLTFAANVVTAGELSPFALKMTNVVIHITCGALVYWLALLLLQSPALHRRNAPVDYHVWLPLLAALLWLLHPLHVSTVMYSVQRMAQLSTLFTLAGLVVFLRYRLRWVDLPTGQVDRDSNYGAEFLAALLWVTLFCALAVFSKENGALLPWLIVATEVALFQAIWLGRRRNLMAMLGGVLLITPLLMLAALFVIAPEWVFDRYLTREFTLEERVLTQARVLWHYVAWTFLPSLTQLGFFHDDILLSRGLFAPLTTLLSILAWLAVTVAAFFLRRRMPLLFFALLFFLIAHSMESGVIPLEMVFEHRNYLPSVSLAILAAWLLLHLGEKLRGEGASLPGWILGAVCVLALSLLLGTRAYMWRDEISLARFNVVNHPDSPRANFYYANALYSRFLNAEREGLPETDRAALAVSARQYYLNMHALDERDIAPLVMLYQLDSRHFPALAQQRNWLSSIEALADSRRLQRSDTTALGALVKHVLAQGGADRRRVDGLLTKLRERAPGNLGLVALHFRLMKGQVARRAELAAMLEDYLARKPNSRKAAAYLAQFYGSEAAGQNIPATYEALALWLANDRDWQEISTILAVFEP